jgi:hypothetical protein
MSDDEPDVTKLDVRGGVGKGKGKRQLRTKHRAAAAEAVRASTGARLALNAYLPSNHPTNTRTCNPDWATYRVADLTAAGTIGARQGLEMTV